MQLDLSSFSLFSPGLNIIVSLGNGEDFHAGEKLIVEKVTCFFIKIIIQKSSNHHNLLVCLSLQTLTISIKVSYKTRPWIW